jgi:tRNA nucleotidyltransferase/poly(A) polymerase
LIFDFVDGLVPKKIFNNLLNFIKTWKRVKFPISGNDLIFIGYNNGLIIGRNIKIIEKWWLKKLCSPDRKSCLDFEKTLPRS